jgi:hypothetical protein
MFTDIMTCCGVNQNGVLNMTYEILEAKKPHNKQTPPPEHVKESAKGNFTETLKLNSLGPSQMISKSKLSQN